MGVKNQFPYWWSIHAETFANAEPPFIGVNLMTCKKENLERLLENLRHQTDYVHRLGGKMLALTTREHDDHYSIIWCFDYPKDFTWVDPDLEEETRYNNTVICAEWHELSDTYYWYLLDQDAATFPATVDDLHRQVSPKSDEEVAKTRQFILDYAQRDLEMG